MNQTSITFHFKKPVRISPVHLDQIRDLVKKGGAVGLSYIHENIHNAFLIGYALNDRGRVVGTSTLKHPKEEYRKKIEISTGLDLSGYLERGYTCVEDEYGDQNIADILIKGLIDRSKKRKIYVTINMNNQKALKLTDKNGMVFAAQYIHHISGHEIGLFVNKPL